MARYNRFVFLVDKHERRMISEMAQRLQRKDADAVRFVVLEAARALEADKPTVTAQSMGAANVQP